MHEDTPEAMASDSISSVRATASVSVLGRFCLTLNATCVSDNCSASPPIVVALLLAHRESLCRPARVSRRRNHAKSRHSASVWLEISSSIFLSGNWVQSALSSLSSTSGITNNSCNIM